jgi:hypothetical protein
MVNQNWAPEWTSNVGTVKSIEKQLAVDVPAGKSTVELAFKSRLLTMCLLVSLLTFAAVMIAFAKGGLAWLRDERKRWGTMPTWPDEEPAEGAADEKEVDADADDEVNADADGKADADAEEKKDKPDGDAKEPSDEK